MGVTIPRILPIAPHPGTDTADATEARMFRKMLARLLGHDCPPRLIDLPRRARPALLTLEDRTVPATVMYTGTYGWESWLGDAVAVTVTVTHDAAGHEGLYLWNYRLENESFADGVGSFAVSVGDPQGVGNLGSSNGWTWDVGTFMEDPNLVSWHSGGELDSLMGVGESGDFWFTTPAFVLGMTTGFVSDGGYAFQFAGPTVGPQQAPALPTITVEKISDAAEGGADGMFRFTRTGDTSQALTINVGIGGTAEDGVDFATLGSKTMVDFATNSATADLVVDVTDDSTPEFSEAVTASLLAGENYQAGLDNEAVLRIADNEAPTVSLQKVNALEGGPDGAFLFSRTGDTSGPLTVSYTANGTATPGTDYSTLSGSVVFAAGSARASVVVETINDDAAESTETISLAISSDPSYTITGPSSETLSLVDDDSAAPSDPTISVTPFLAAGESGQAGVFRFTRTGDVSQPLTVFAALSGTATAGADFDQPDLHVSFSAGVSTTYLPIYPISDALTESTETVVATILPSGSYAVGQSSATVDLVDGDTPPQPPPPPPVPTGRVDGFVWNDLDGDGVKDPSESGAADVGVWLRSGDDVVRAAATDALGMYYFSELAGGDYTILLTPPSELTPPASFAGGLDVQLADEEEAVVADVGLVAASGTGSVGNLVWNDSDGDGIQDPGEGGLAGIAIDLYHIDNGYYSGLPTATTVTDTNGQYSFSGLGAGDYDVSVISPIGSVLTTAGTGVLSVALGAGQAFTGANFGLNKPAATPSVTLDEPTVIDGKYIKKL